MSLIDVRTSRVLFTVLLFALGLGFLYIARRTLIAFLFAVFFAYLMDPAVSRVEKWVRGRGRAIGLIYLAAGGSPDYLLLFRRTARSRARGSV